MSTKRKDICGYVKLKETWVPTEKYTTKKVENFGAFSIKAAVRGSYCQQCGHPHSQQSPPYWGIS